MFEQPINQQKLEESLNLSELVNIQREAEPSIQLISFNELPIEEMARIYAECFNAPPWNESWTIQSATAELTRDTFRENADYVLAGNQEKSVGLAIGLPLDKYEGAESFSDFGSTEGKYYIAEVAVDPSNQTRGLGTTMVNDLVRVAEATGYTEVITRTQNEAAIRMFEKAGFKRVGEIEASTGGNSYISTVLAKRL